MIHFSVSLVSCRIMEIKSIFILHCERSCRTSRIYYCASNTRSYRSKKTVFSIRYTLRSSCIICFTRTTIHDQRQYRFVRRNSRIDPLEFLINLGQVILMNIINGLLKFLASASYAIIYIYANELFPTNVRNTGMGICSMVARIGAIIGTFCNDYLVSCCYSKERIF